MPSTKAWLLLLGLLTTLLAASHQLRPAAGGPAVLAGHRLAPAPRHPAPRPEAAVIFTASASL
ncbi:MAG TPA: hypothetical protein VFO93_02565 [Hymenobacter sp.]|uniref:hypothetical protein n=1 Tax=Hymenobacter sp. TaxID=1898978 RepID=UPI002D7F95A2|nr:hypothetical protein [Hymenobacter sp.]HET9502397.1 hypothetical protein [Hymenobacter sp.]